MGSNFDNVDGILLDFMPMRITNSDNLDVYLMKNVLRKVVHYLGNYICTDSL